MNALAKKTFKIMYFATLLSYSNIILSSEVEVCNSIAGNDFVSFLKKVELEYKQNKEVKNLAVQEMINCLKGNEVCIVGYKMNSQYSSKIKLWYSKKYGDSLIGEYQQGKYINGKYHKGDSILFAVLQNKHENSCTAAYKVGVMALPWYRKAWRKTQNALISSDSISSYPDPTFSRLSPSPNMFADALKNSYQYWINKK